jgi:succinate dehydrogenase hydrophobic anchor subunit
MTGTTTSSALRHWLFFAAAGVIAAIFVVYLVVSRLLGRRARQERVAQRDKWRVLHRLPFLDVLFVRLPRL